MLYVAIDQHAKQITVAVRNDQGEDVLKRQVSTRPEKIKEFFDRVVAMDRETRAYSGWFCQSGAPAPVSAFRIPMALPRYRPGSLSCLLPSVMLPG